MLVLRSYFTHCIASTINPSLFTIIRRLIILLESIHMTIILLLVRNVTPTVSGHVKALTINSKNIPANGQFLR